MPEAKESKSILDNIKLGKNKNETMLILIMIALIVIAIYFFIFLKPSLGSLADIAPKLSMMEQNLEDARRMIAGKGTAEKNRLEFKEKMESYKALFPSSDEAAKVLENLSLIAGNSGVKIVGIKPFRGEGYDAQEEKGLYNEFPVEIIARSGYHELGRFIHKLETGERFVSIEDLEIKGNPANINKHRVRLITSTFILAE